MTTKIEWAEFTLPPINLWNAPRISAVASDLHPGHEPSHPAADSSVKNKFLVSGKQPMKKLPCHIVHHTNDVPPGYVSLTDIKAVLGPDEYLRVRNLMHASEIESCRVMSSASGHDSGRYAPCHVNPNNMTLMEFLPRQWLRDRLLDVPKNLALTPAQLRQQSVRLNNVSGARELVAQLNAEQLAETVRQQEIEAKEELRAREEAAAAIETAKAAAAPEPGIEKPSFTERLLAALEASTVTQVQMIAALNRLEKIWAD